MLMRKVTLLMRTYINLGRVSISDNQTCISSSAISGRFRFLDLISVQTENSASQIFEFQSNYSSISLVIKDLEREDDDPLAFPGKRRVQ